MLDIFRRPSPTVLKTKENELASLRRRRQSDEKLATLLGCEGWYEFKDIIAESVKAVDSEIATINALQFIPPEKAQLRGLLIERKAAYQRILSMADNAGANLKPLDEQIAVAQKAVNDYRARLG